MKPISERLAALSPAKRALLEKMLLQKAGSAGPGGDGAPDAPVRRPDGTAPAPLSFAQQRLWFLDQMGITGHAYNMPVHLRLRGRLHRPALAASLAGLLRRHEVLRTVIAEVGELPVQVVRAPLAVTLPVVDLSGLGVEARDAEARRLLRAERRRRFDLARDPSLRATLVVLAGDEHLLLATFHHIACDGWSIGVFVRELGALYNGVAAGVPARLPALPLQYADFAAWQRRRIQGEVLDRQLAYWKERLRGMEPLRLPTDRPRRAVESFRGAGHGFTVPSGTMQAIEALGRRLDATPFMTLLAAFQTLLARYTGQTRFPVGSPIANRTRGEIEGLVGFFVNSLVFTAEVEDDPPFSELVRRVRESALGGYAHQDLPFERLVEELQPDRDLSRNPVFQVVFALQQDDAVRPRFELAGLAVEPVEPDELTVRFDMELHVWQVDGGLRGECLYNTDLFDPGTVERMMGHFRAVLAAAVARPDERLSRLPLASEAELARVRHAWNATEAECPRRAIHELFAEQARRTPDATALLFERAGAGGEPAAVEALTYRELDTRANRLARHLRRHGVRAEVTVGVLLDRSPDLVVAILAVLKAGGAFVPLDPGYPAPRLRFMLEDSRASVLITEAAHGERAAAFPGRVVRADGDEWRGEEGSAPEAWSHHDSLAYVMYTSGSTGEPKGVATTHRNVVRLVTAPSYLRITPDDVFLLLAPVSFDASTLELWGPLLNGARLVVFPPHTPSLAELGRFIERHRPTTVWLTAGLFSQMVEHQAECLRGLRWLLAGGDVLPARQVRAFLEDRGQTILVNGYGPTENTTFTCCHPMVEAASIGAEVPIGRPITNTQVYVLDGWLAPSPVGVVGELGAGGEGLARGYHHRPALTAERFVPDAGSGRAGARLYRTGDRARWRADGVVEFLGRLDRQVKVRGFRVEPGEIERQLVLHPAVREAVVVVRDDVGGNTRLCAYFVPAPEAAVPEATRRERVASHVAEWRTVFDEHIYQEVPAPAAGPSPADPLFNTAGWVSSYDGRALSLEEMRVWAGDIVSHVLRRHPRRVLEIGCGTGMLLFALAPHCEAYWGTDVSTVALDHVRAQLRAHRPDLRQVHLAQRAATDFEGFPPGSFDTVVLSSVVQYFPDVEYLLAVLDGCVRVVRPGGTIVLGDLRHQGLLDAFHASVQLARADLSTPLDVIRRTVAEKVAQETELLVDPALFPAIMEADRGIGWAEVHLQRGAHDNELTRFRYHAVLGVGTRGDLWSPPLQPTWVPAATGTLESIRTRLAASGAGVASPPGFGDLLNARLAADVRAARLLGAPGGPATVDAWRARAAAPGEEAGVDPEALHGLAAELGYDARLSPSPGARPDRFDAVFVPRGPAGAAAPIVAPRRTGPARPWPACANRPLQARVNAGLAAELRGHLLDRLPEYMVPSFFVPLDELPRTPSGKSDRGALPAPEPRRPAAAPATAPRTPTEVALTALWQDVLGLAEVGVDDNFFRVGGHSLLATQLVARVRRTLHVDLPLRAFFENPTVATLAKLVDSLAAGTRAVPMPTIVPAPERRHEPFPLTDIQQAYWVGRTDIFDLGNVSAHMYLEIECRDLDLDRFEAAWRRLVARHDMLRMVILPDGTQRVLPEVPDYRIAVSDFRAATSEARAAGLQAIRDRMSHQVLPSDRWPLFEIQAARVDRDITRLGFSLDALLGDAQSFALLFVECFRLYQDPGHPTPPLALTFRDYVLAEEALQRTERYERARQYWLDRLETLPPSPQLPLATNPARLRSPRFERRQVEIDAEQWRRLKERAARADVTPAGLLLAVFAETLGGWAAEPRFTINLTLFNRLPLHPQVDDLIGDFTSLTLLEVDHATDEPFEARAARLQRQLWQDLDHRYFGGLRVVRELARRRGATGIAMPVVFTSTLGLSGVSSEDAGFRRLGQFVHASNQTPQVWLDHGVSEHDGGLVLIWNFVDGLFPPGLIDDMVLSESALVRELAGSEAAWTRPVRVRVPARRLAVRQAVNGTAAPLTGHLLHTPFLDQVERRGDAPAVVSGDRCLGYRELHAEARAVERWLVAAGAGPGRLVAVVMEKGWEQVAAVLGVSLSGAAYVPIDPDWPLQRIGDLLQSTGAELVLTQSRVDGALAWPANVRRRCVDAPVAPDPGPAGAGAAARPEDLAYVIFTSGSTGTPKGVMVDHRGAVNTILDVNARFGVGASDRVLALSALSFDLSVYDVFGTLAAGGTIVLPAADGARDPQHWAELCGRHGVTVWNSVPALMQLLVEHAEAHGETLPPALRLALLSGDWIPLDLPGRLRARAAGLRVVSLGGATEASIWSIAYPIETVEPHWTSIPYGAPLANQTMHVLDRRLDPAPDWVAGDLYIGGTGLALGYWRDAERTEASFPTDPRTGERLYRTGDRARYWPDGTIEFLGRLDAQVKLQGHRVELGEIEAALVRHPLVGQAAVAAVGGRFEGKRLVAYVVPAKGTARGQTSETLGRTLSRALGEVLPAHMVPSSYVLLGALPVTANGKVDRKALPAPSGPAAERPGYVAPRSALERQLADLWSMVLAVDQIGIHDNFFEAGGDSLTAIKLISRLRAELDVDLPMRRLFDAPTVADLADGIETIRWAARGREAVPPVGAGPREEGQI